MIHQANQTYQKYKNLLANHTLFQINYKYHNITPITLSYIYTPGVGSVCLQIKDKPQLLYNYTNRNNSVAVVSTGQCLHVSGISVLPYVQWICLQIKYYVGLDCYPIILKSKQGLNQTLNDIGNSIKMIVLLQTLEQQNGIDKDIIVLSHYDIMMHLKQTKEISITQGMYTAYLLKFLSLYNINGAVYLNDIKLYLKDLDQNNIWNQIVLNSKECKENIPFPFQLDDKITKLSEQNRIFSNFSTEQNATYLHQKLQGKIKVSLTFSNFHYLKLLFTEKNILKLVQQIYANPALAEIFTSKKYMCLIITDGTAILGLGNIGPRAGLPVMEGKSVIFKYLGNVNIFPLCIKPKKTIQQEIKCIINLSQGIAAINLEDIAAPQCFQIEQKLKESLSIPIFHDDQHGTAIVVLAGLINASKLTDKKLSQSKIVINGAGAAGMTIALLLFNYGVGDIIVCDTKGSIFKDRKQNMNDYKKKISTFTNRNNIQGTLENCLQNANIFVGVSGPNTLKKQWIKKMQQKPIIFALSNPIPQILPDQALEGGAFIVATGRSDFHNQINNSLVFPGIFKGILQSKVKEVNMDIKIKAAKAIAMMAQKQLSVDNIIPNSLNQQIANKIAEEMKKL